MLDSQRIDLNFRCARHPGRHWPVNANDDLLCEAALSIERPNRPAIDSGLSSLSNRHCGLRCLSEAVCVKSRVIIQNVIGNYVLEICNTSYVSPCSIPINGRPTTFRTENRPVFYCSFIWLLFIDSLKHSKWLRETNTMFLLVLLFHCLLRSKSLNCLKIYGSSQNGSLELTCCFGPHRCRTDGCQFRLEKVSLFFFFGTATTVGLESPNRLNSSKVHSASRMFLLETFQLRLHPVAL